MISRKDNTIQFSEISGEFTNQVNDADKLRTESLQRLLEIRGKRQTYHERQLKRLVTRFGEKHPKVLRQAERIINEREMENYLSFSIDKADNQIDAIKDSFVLHGRVVADDIKGLAGLGVQLLDAKNNVIGKPVKTDKQGFYTLVIDVDEPLKTKKSNIVISDKQGTQIHKERLPITVKADSIEERDIVIAAIDKMSRDKNKLLKEALRTNQPAARKKVSKKVKSVKKPKTRKRVNKKS